MEQVYRSEYPRPQFVRADWMSLNGLWDFSFDKACFDRTIRVPFAYEAPLSGIGEKAFHSTVWYRRRFVIPESWAGRRVILYFGAVDYQADVWINGAHCASHCGGQVGFSADITDHLQQGENEIRVCVKDLHTALDIPRGKQYWRETSTGIFYTATMGIWQSVWLEPVAPIYIKDVRITPLLDKKSVQFEYTLSDYAACTLETVISYQGKTAADVIVHPMTDRGSVMVRLEEAQLGVWNLVEELGWTPEQPRLFDVSFRLTRNGVLLDEVSSYFGLRSVCVENGRFLLNGRPYYQRLLLDQGYWPQGLLTAPTDEDFVRDIQTVKNLGYNGVRKHQKVEDPRYLYHADRMGLLVWGEIGSGYTFSQRLIQSFTAEWTEAVQRDYNHPCIVVWTPINESWGVTELAHENAQYAFCRAIYHLTKALDQTRPVSENDGWEHTADHEIMTIHDYESNQDTLKERYATLNGIMSSQPAGRRLLIRGVEYDGSPILVSECGGVSFQPENIGGWGYSVAESENDFLERYRAVLQPLLASALVQGFCYTQFCDVEQETNGLLTYDRIPKVAAEKLRTVMETCGK